VTAKVSSSAPTAKTQSLNRQRKQTADHVSLSNIQLSKNKKHKTASLQLKSVAQSKPSIKTQSAYQEKHNKDEKNPASGEPPSLVNAL